MARRLAPFMLILLLCALPAAAAKPPQKQPLDPDALAFLTGETFFTSGSRVVVCSEVDLAAANARTDLQKAACTVWLTCPDGYTTRTCTSPSGACSAKCGFVKCDGVKYHCPTPCCEESIYCPDGTPISCQAFGGNQCLKPRRASPAMGKRFLVRSTAPTIPSRRNALTILATRLGIRSVPARVVFARSSATRGHPLRVFQIKRDDRPGSRRAGPPTTLLPPLSRATPLGPLLGRTFSAS